MPSHMVDTNMLMALIIMATAIEEIYKFIYKAWDGYCMNVQLTSIS